MRTISRAEWGARPPTQIIWTTATEVYLHHTVGAGTDGPDPGEMAGDDYMRATQRFHMDDKGWFDIAYNFLIDPVDCLVYEGRGWGVRPGAQRGHNTGTWAVAVMGDFGVLVPSPGLLDTIAELVRLGIGLGHLPAGVVLTGHRDAPGQSTSCPGANLYSVLPTINAKIAEEGTDVITETLNEAQWREMFRLGIVKGGSEEIVVDYWVANAAKRTKAEHQAASADVVVALARTATEPGPPGPPGPPGESATLVITGNAEIP